MFGANTFGGQYFGGAPVAAAGAAETFTGSVVNASAASATFTVNRPMSGACAAASAASATFTAAYKFTGVCASASTASATFTSSGDAVPRPLVGQSALGIGRPRPPGKPIKWSTVLRETVAGECAVVGGAGRVTVSVTVTTDVSVVGRTGVTACEAVERVRGPVLADAVVRGGTGLCEARGRVTLLVRGEARNDFNGGTVRATAQADFGRVEEEELLLAL